MPEKKIFDLMNASTGCRCLNRRRRNSHDNWICDARCNAYGCFYCRYYGGLLWVLYDHPIALAATVTFMAWQLAVVLIYKAGGAP